MPGNLILPMLSNSGSACSSLSVFTPDLGKKEVKSVRGEFDKNGICSTGILEILQNRLWENTCNDCVRIDSVLVVGLAVFLAESHSPISLVLGSFSSNELCIVTVSKWYFCVFMHLDSCAFPVVKQNINEMIASKL